MVVGYLFESMSSQLFFYFSLMAFSIPPAPALAFHDAPLSFPPHISLHFPGKEAPCCLRLIDGLII